MSLFVIDLGPGLPWVPRDGTFDDQCLLVKGRVVRQLGRDAQGG